MTMPPLRRRLRSAFTLIELLVVVGIIIILIGILLPVVGHLRTEAYKADTSQVISQLSNAITQYYGDFNAYPGPLSEDQIEANGATDANGNVTTSYTFTVVGCQSPTQSTITTGAGGTTTTNTIGSPDNLVLGLLGGLNYTTNANGAVSGYTFVPAEVGLGPLQLTAIGYVPMNPHRYPPYVQMTAGTSNLLMWCGTVNGVATQSNSLAAFGATPVLTGFTDQAGYTGNDSIVPKFVDRFPSPMPILYLRARTGAAGVIANGNQTDPTTSKPAEYQYDMRQINRFTSYHIGLKSTSAYHALYAGTTGIVVPTASSTPAWPGTIDAAGTTNTSTGSQEDIYPYFVNSTIACTNTSDYNYYCRPRAVDSFMLISAGPDSIYGTADDIASFGDISH